MGNDQNEQAGLYGATAAMRVWAGIFRSLPSAPLRVNNKGLDWQYVAAEGVGSTDADCPGARRFPFVAGFAPAYAPCAPPAAPEEEARQSGGWRSWFGLDRKQPEPASTPPSDVPAR
jgi:penicillin-binding protein 1B